MESTERTCLQEIERLGYIAIFVLFLISLYGLLGTRGIIPFKIRGVFLIILPFCFSYLLTPFMCWFSKKLGILDQPDERKMHCNATPLLGGVSIYLAFVTGVLLTLWYSYELKGVVYAATLVFLSGLLDDIVKLSSVFRLLIQILAVFILFYHGMEIDFIPEITRYHICEKIVTIAWVVGITNGVNFLDGLDGLCGGFGAIASLFFGVIAFLTGQYFLMFLAFSLSGGCFGFLPWNFDFRHRTPARIFMGDGGSLFIGFTLASFAIMGDWAANKTVALAVPVLILFLPIFDTTMTTYFRIKEGSVKTIKEWLDYVGKDHFHHRLFAVDIRKRDVVLIMYTVTIMLGFSAIIVRTGGPLEAYLALMQAFVVLVVFTAIIVIVRKKYDSFAKTSGDAVVIQDE